MRDDVFFISLDNREDDLGSIGKQEDGRVGEKILSLVLDMVGGEPKERSVTNT